MSVSSILVPTDFSEGSGLALRYAVAVARRWESRITLLHTVEFLPALTYPELAKDDADREIYRERMVSHADGELAKTKARYADSALDLDSRVRGGDPRREILEEAEELPADLIVMATHGRTGFSHAILGSITEKVLRRAPCPVLSLKTAPAGMDSPDGEPRIQRILYATDLSTLSLKALPAAIQWARAFGAKLHLLYVMDDPSNFPFENWENLPTITPEEFLRRHQDHAIEQLENVARSRVKPGEVETQCHFRRGHVHREIVATAKALSQDLIVMTTHGRTGLHHAWLGSVAERVLRLAECPVLTVRPTGE